MAFDPWPRSRAPGRAQETLVHADALYNLAHPLDSRAGWNLPDVGRVSIGEREVRTMKKMARVTKWLSSPSLEGPTATVLLRLMAGGVFVSEGILKFVYANQGVGRFTKLGFPLTHLTASLVGAWEIVGGALLMLGLLTRGAAILFAIEMGRGIAVVPGAGGQGARGRGPGAVVGARVAGGARADRHDVGGAHGAPRGRRGVALDAARGDAVMPLAATNTSLFAGSS